VVGGSFPTSDTACKSSITFSARPVASPQQPCSNHIRSAWAPLFIPIHNRISLHRQNCHISLFVDHKKLTLCPRDLVQLGAAHFLPDRQKKSILEQMPKATDIFSPFLLKKKLTGTFHRSNPDQNCTVPLCPLGHPA
jgi:hypothetical protein